MTINYLSSDADIEAIEAEIKSNGCVVIKDLIDRSTVEQIKSDMVSVPFRIDLLSESAASYHWRS